VDGKVDKIKVLYVDDEENNLIAFKAVFRRDYQVFTAIGGAEGLEIVLKETPEVIITDQRMPLMTGIEFLQEVIKVNSSSMRLLLTGYADISAVIDAINKGQVYRYLTKPWNIDEVRQAIDSSHELYRLRKQNAKLLEELEIANNQLEFLLRQKLLS
jgi:response regulator RpfG family c-di-GMP phosphodiesterase